MTRHFMLSNGHTLTLHLFDQYFLPPPVEKGFQRMILNPHWAIDEEVCREVEVDSNQWEWVDERTSE